MLATTALFGAGFGQSPRLVQHAGWFQRASITAGFAWLSALSVSARSARLTGSTGHPIDSVIRAVAASRRPALVAKFSRA
jgi:hypothetical protein